MHFKPHHSAKKTAKVAPMRSTSLTKSHDIQYPGVHDVLCGRGGHAMAHPGNLKYRTLIDSCKPRYNQASTKFERSQLAANIVTMWRSQTPEGRFLTKTHPLEPDSVWHDIGNKDAIKKVSQTLRERRSYPMISGTTTTAMTNLIPQQQQQQQKTKPPQPIVDAIITSAQQQEQLEKIRLIEEEIKQLQQQNISQGLIEQQLRHQQMYHHPNQQAQGQQESMAQVQNPGFDTGMNMPIPEEPKQQERLITIQSDQPMKDVQIAAFDDQVVVPQERMAGRTRSRTSLTNKMPSREALWDMAESSGSFSLGSSILDSERSNLTNSSTSTRQSSKSSFLHKLFGSSNDDHNNNNKTNHHHHNSPDRQTSGNSTVSTKTRTLMNESLHSISDNGSSRSFKLASFGGSSNSNSSSGGGLFSGPKSTSSDKTSPAGKSQHRGSTAQSTMVTG